MSPMVFTRAFALPYLLFCAAAGAQEGDAVRELIDASLSPHEIRLVAVTPDAVQYKDKAGRPGSLPLADVLAIVPIADGAAGNPPQPAAVRAVARLTDGQVLPGSFSGGAGETINWDSTLWSVVRLKFDALSSVALAPEATLPEPGAGTDAVGLLNADRVEGFIESIDGTLVIEQGGRKTQLPLDRVGAVRFANPPVAPSGPRVWLADGTVASLASLEVFADGTTKLISPLPGASGPATSSPPAADLRAIAFDMGRFRALATLDLRTLDAGTDRRWTPPIRVGDASAEPLGAADVELPGPITVEWTLPPGAARFAGDAELPLECRAWGDCDLVFELASPSGTAELFRTHLNRAQPTASFNIELRGAGQFRMKVLAGKSGPIQDRVVLRRALLLLDAPGRT